ISTAAVKEYSDDSVRSAEIVRALTSFPVLATIPDILTVKDTIRRKKRLMIWIISLAVAAVVMVAAFDFRFMDLYPFLAKLARRVGM
ncbi:MAG TPA: hypothetical protein PLA83_14585, partial [Deltaproteobacteria bacterium]|nr:hypothetical protein [Deltaproteobacteria bacterium]